MNAQETSTPGIAYKWISYCFLGGFVYYWLFSLGIIFFNRTMHTAAPRQTAVYYTFWRQNWRLFAFTKLYNRELNFVVRDKLAPSNADTIDLVKYFIKEKSSYAPFNNYDDALDQMLYWTMNGLETQLYEYQKKLKLQYPGRPDSFYMRQSNVLVLADSFHQNALQNLSNYGKYVMRAIHRDTAGKEFQLQLLHKYIAPPQPPAGTVSSADKRTIFISAFKSF